MCDPMPRASTCGTRLTPLPRPHRTNPKAQGGTKIACFDFDGTLVGTKSGADFARTAGGPTCAELVAACPLGVVMRWATCCLVEWHLLFQGRWARFVGHPADAACRRAASISSAAPSQQLELSLNQLPAMPSLATNRCCRCPSPIRADDWKWFNKDVPDKLRTLHEEGYQLLIIRRAVPACCVLRGAPCCNSDKLRCTKRATTCC